MLLEIKKVIKFVTIDKWNESPQLNLFVKKFGIPKMSI